MDLEAWLTRCALFSHAICLAELLWVQPGSRHCLQAVCMYSVYGKVERQAGSPSPHFALWDAPGGCSGECQDAQVGGSKIITAHVSRRPREPPRTSARA